MTAPDQPAEHAADQLLAAPKSPADDLRDRIAEALRLAFHHWITAEWICCEPLAKGHKLCKKGHTTRRMVRALLADDPEEWPPKSPIIDAAMAEVQPVLDAKDAEIKRLHVEVSRFRRAWEDAMADGDQQAVQRLSLRNQLNQERQRAEAAEAVANNIGAKAGLLRLDLATAIKRAETAERELAALRTNQQIGDLP